MSQPPSVGPITGPTMTPMPHSAITRPCCSRGNSLSSTTCDSGTSAAPNAPCTVRKSTISMRSVAMPHSIDTTVKPAMQTPSTALSPKRVPSQPASGVAIALMTI